MLHAEWECLRKAGGGNGPCEDVTTVLKCPMPSMLRWWLVSYFMEASGFIID